MINSEYKQRNMKIWNEIAPRYHKRWASVNKGPFQSTKKLIELVKINKNDMVLDVACGTGVVTKQIQKKVGNGFVDFDNDGDRDIFVACGHLYPNVERFDDRTSYRARNILFENSGQGKFRNVTDSAGSGMRVKLSSSCV